MYSKGLRNLFKKKRIEIGDKIKILKKNKEYIGILMPRTMGNEEIVIIKLDRKD